MTIRIRLVVGFDVFNRHNFKDFISINVVLDDLFSIHTIIMSRFLMRSDYVLP